MSNDTIVISMFKTIAKGALLGVGFLLVVAPVGFLYKTKSLDKVIDYVVPPVGAQSLNVTLFDESDIPDNPHMGLAKDAAIIIPANYVTYNVNPGSNIQEVLGNIRKNGGNGAIVFADGEYKIGKELSIDVPNVMFLSQSNDPRKVIIVGRGMRRAKNVENLIKVMSSGFLLSGITLRQAGNHLIQIAAEKNSDIPVIRNCILQDAYEQIIKVSYDKETPEVFSDAGLIEYCLFEYTAGIGPNYYIGGVDAHGIRNWTIRNNVFKDIASPTKRIAEHAVHIWNNASGNIVEGNVIIDSDRGVGFGMRKSHRHSNIRYSNYGGEIKNNLIFHSDNKDKAADTGIIIEDSPYTVIEGNMVYLAHDYRRAIEYRFPPSRDLVIKNNRTNKSIASRDGGDGDLSDNSEDLELAEFLVKLNQRLDKLNLLPR